MANGGDEMGKTIIGARNDRAGAAKHHALQKRDRENPTAK
jgi:hypothetical protein